ncbi:MAG TPA: MBL fold metallo-hydrolase [Bacteroidia bacterium]|nr:MBL fold metallo-hydrolase [Bacteroidia bacterium]
MKLTFLGTGTSQGIPVIACDCAVCTSGDPKDDRLRASVMLEVADKVFVIDTGPDFRQQMLRSGVQRLDAVVFTHPHKDHIAGMDDIRAFNFRQKADIDIYANSMTLKGLEREFYYVFEEVKYPGVPGVNVHLIDEEPFSVAGIEFIPIPVLHYRMPVLGFRVGDMAYITDANYISEESKEKLKGLKVLVLNALRRTDHLSHFTLDQAVALAQELGAEQTFFTHMSHLMGLHSDVEQELPVDIHLAFDGLVVEA